MDVGESGASEARLALEQLVERLSSVAAISDSAARMNAVGEIQDAGHAHYATLLGCYLDDTRQSYKAREDHWKALAEYQTQLTQAVCIAAGAALSASSAVRALSAIRSLAKLHLVHYSRMPRRLWRVAYKIHSSAGKRGFASTSVHAPGSQQGMTTVEQELLRLLMLQISAPDMMTPVQVEAAARAVERLGAEFTLRLPGVADNPFYFDPEGEFPPRRAKGRDNLPQSARYFGPGIGYDSLEHMLRQVATDTPEKFRLFGTDLAPREQANAVQHLLTFWQVDCPYSPPAHSPAEGSLLVSHGYSRVWQHLSQSSGGAHELSLVEDSAMVAQPPEVWQLSGKGGNELAAQVPPSSRSWAKCGELVGLTTGNDEHWVGLIRRIHTRADNGLDADFALLGHQARACTLREVLGDSDDSGFTDAASRQFGLSAVNIIIVADGTDPAKPANLLLSPEHWKAGGVFELKEDDESRYLRCLEAIRHGPDFVRATFEWLSAPP
ncbi:MAG: hypothetical protein PVH25_13135 [Burkholderiales bacterium]